MFRPKLVVEPYSSIRIALMETVEVNWRLPKIPKGRCTGVQNGDVPTLSLAASGQKVARSGPAVCPDAHSVHPFQAKRIDNAS